MYMAELRGKVSRKIENSEDILTSNVFSFLKYSNRLVYLKKFLRVLDIDASDGDLIDAEFLFWPRYDDGTEPDIVILIGPHYLLFEAKYFSPVAEENNCKAGQLVREFKQGISEAKNLGLAFRLVAITADSCSPDEILSDIPAIYRSSVDWVNWQTLAGILLNTLEEDGENASDQLFSEDLYDLLDRKHLRGFLSFNRLEGKHQSRAKDTLFFSAATATHRGGFIGFLNSLSTAATVHPSPPACFLSGWEHGQIAGATTIVPRSRDYFFKLPMVGKRNEPVFFERENQ